MTQPLGRPRGIDGEDWRSLRREIDTGRNPQQPDSVRDADWDEWQAAFRHWRITGGPGRGGK